MKEAPSDIYPPTTITGRPPSRPARGSGIAAVIVVAVAIGAVVGYSAAGRAASQPTPTSVQPQAPTRDEQSANTNPTELVSDKRTAPLTDAELTTAAEARLGIDLDDLEPAEQMFLIALSTVGTDVGAVGHVTHP